jgi:hypothetical protein
MTQSAGAGRVNLRRGIGSQGGPRRLSPSGRTPFRQALKMFKRIDFLKTVPTVGVPRFEENTSFGECRTFLAGRESKAQIRLEMAAATGPNCQRVRSEKTWLGTSWRREWDSNPRYGFPHTRFPSVRLKPLGHLSGCPLLKGRKDFCKGLRTGPRLFP